MNRNVYDTDCVTWSPQGRIFQIEYAAESVKLGTCVVGLRSQTHAAIIGLRRAVSKLAGYNDKIVKIDKHVGATFSGITSDATLLFRSMRTESMNYRFTFESQVPIEKLIVKVAEISQKNTLEYSKRPFGVGLLVAGCDKNGPHIFETVPSGDYYEHYAQAFGSRCQAAKTFLEANLEAIGTANAEELLRLGIQALASTVPIEQDLPEASIDAAVVGVDKEWTELTSEEIKAHLSQCRQIPAA